MQTPRGYRKRVRHYDLPGDCRELTFSCYHQMPLLDDQLRCVMLARSIDRSLERHAFRLAAFVFMPEHVHLLIWPASDRVDVSAVLKAIKQPFSNRVRRLLEDDNQMLLRRLTVRERPGKLAFRFWQEGGGYDRNLTEPAAICAAIEYIHLNPVRRGLAMDALSWRWSSCHHYHGSTADRELPRIHGLPWQYLA